MGCIEKVGVRWRGSETVEEDIGRYGEGQGGCWIALRRLRRRWGGIEAGEENIGRYGEGHGGCWTALRRLRRRWGGIEAGEEGVGRPPAPPWPAVARRPPLRPERQASRPAGHTQRPHVSRGRQDRRTGDEVNRISDGVDQ